MEEQSYQEVLDFWFQEIDPKMWTINSDEFNQEIEHKFKDLHQSIINGAHKDWQDYPESSLALILILDQFSRNIYPNNKKSLQSDKFALKIAKQSLEKGFDKKVETGRNIFYHPYMHSEDLENQEKSVKFHTQLAEDTKKDIESVTQIAVDHRYIIRRFGRFPQRNKLLNRESTTEELEYLKSNI